MGRHWGGNTHTLPATSATASVHFWRTHTQICVCQFFATSSSCEKIKICGEKNAKKKKRNLDYLLGGVILLPCGPYQWSPFRLTHICVLCLDVRVYQRWSRGICSSYCKGVGAWLTTLLNCSNKWVTACGLQAFVQTALVIVDDIVPMLAAAISWCDLFRGLIYAHLTQSRWRNTSDWAQSFQLDGGHGHKQTHLGT